MAMAVKSFNSGIGPECWPTSTVGWDHEWEWQEEEETVKDEPVVVGTPAASFFFSLESPASPVVAAAAATTTTTKSKSSSTSLKLGRSSPQDSLSPPPPPSKKQRPMSPPTTLVPRCQVENCKADLSGCKDYHKRHKVCEMHSKAPKAIANGIEQRFCQQCSRFHLLKEFDEGKRSCRRRLAGHNERRRKPHPEPHSFFQLSNAGFLHREISTSTLSGVGSPFYSLLSPSPEDIKPSSLLHPHRGSFLNTLDSYTSASNSFSFKNRNYITVCLCVFVVLVLIVVF